MTLSLGLEHAAVVAMIIWVVDLLKKKWINKDYAPGIAVILGFICAVPLIIWRDGALPSGASQIFSTVFIEGIVLGFGAMGSYDIYDFITR